MRTFLNDVFRHLIFSPICPTVLTDTIVVKLLDYPVCYGDYVSFDEAEAECTNYSYAEAVNMKLAEFGKAVPEVGPTTLTPEKTEMLGAIGMCFARKGEPVSVLDIGGGIAQDFFSV